jgi:hypothetical protein
MAIRKDLPFGTARVLNVKDGYVAFLTDDENYKNSVPTDIQKEMISAMDSFLKGERQFAMPEF